jgi:hypothetical protein
MGNFATCICADGAITSLVAGLTLATFSLLVSFKVYKGSKSTFAYTLMAFTFVNGAQYIANAIVLSKRQDDEENFN